MPSDRRITEYVVNTEGIDVPFDQYEVRFH